MSKFDLFFQTQGDPQGLPVIFIHAFPMTYAMWKPQIEALPKKYFGVVYDIRGIGKSPVGDGQYTMEMYVEDLAALMDHLKLSSAVLCGLSLGGYIALRFTERFPNRVKGIVLCNTRSEADNNEGKMNRAQAIKLIKSQGLAAFADSFVGKILSPHSSTQHPEILNLLKNFIIAQDPLGVCGAQLSMISRTDTTPFLPKITCPTLVIHGDEDSLIPIQHARAMSQKIPNSRLEAIAKAGHMTNMENVEQFNKALNNFLEKLK